MSSPPARFWREPARSGPHAFYEVKPQLPRIPDEHLRAVAFIYPSEDAAQRGEQVGGTGFVIGRVGPRGRFQARYVVTNQHVVDRGGHWVRLNRIGGVHIEHVPPDDWVPAPEGDDFAVAPLSLPVDVQPLCLTLETLALTREEVAKLKVGPGDEVYMIGRFVAHGGRATNNPIARFGSIALMPNPQELVRDGRGKDVIAYLTEMRSHVGFSGSPVFLYIPSNSFRGTFGDTSMDDNTDRFRLLGIDTGHKIEPLRVGRCDERVGFVPLADGSYVQHYRDVAIVAPIWQVARLLDREDLATSRACLEEEWMSTHRDDEAVSHVAEAETDFERFEQLARKLVNVPKRELDEKREQS